MRALVIAAVLTLIPAVSSMAAAQDVPVTAAPPVAPFKRGLLVEGDVGVYAPIGRIKNLVAPGPMVRVALGWDFAKWIGVFGSFDSAFLSTGRAPPPPGERAFVLWGFGGGARLALPIGDRVRIPLKVELGMHKADDGGVLAAYGFTNAKDLNLSYGATLGFEYRAVSRHFGILLEGGVRNDSGLDYPAKAQAPLAIVGTLGVHYTL
ncbi:MAG: hypothetical protein ACXVEF_10640 [Polyangiales bacterium]